MEDINDLLQSTEESMNGSVEHLQYELTKVRTGKASTTLLNDIAVNYYGAMTPVNQVASVSTADARTIVIQPWEKNMLRPIENAIFEANIGITPMNDGEVIRLTVPMLTEERRRDLVKQAKHYGEEAKISVRSIRHKALDTIKKAVKDGFSEDGGKDMETEVQNLVNKFTASIDHLIEVKEKDVMHV
ncbi:MAG: ribosome recycling factor [Saprospiraceae bacterium]|nr:ribosome recycling factor [Saprospiraceae bacterium]MCF8249482.1 ribosome recycling factor [Saprospiraceae bacterium]MCF8280106.1 ribosome recycling factor [Bacteroidales bacterium]MCF8310700.1 ribosome recycling factor [Saprospiraceae bacterium]MCF8439469.1 ribosome recycling factor [Saprospiraceae bacterium]